MSDGLCTIPNVFQRLMLQWERFAPYNAGQYFTLDGAIDRDLVARCFRATIIALGLQQVGQHPDAPVMDAPGPLEEFISMQMNRPFARPESPLRAFISSDGAQAHIGIIYRHVVADSASIRLVMRHWFELIHAPRRPRFDPVTLMREPPGGVWRTHWLSLVREVMDETMRMSRIKRVRRLRDGDPSQPIAWRRVGLGDELIGELVRYARSRKVKVNDLFVAAAAEACNHHLAHEDAESRRDLAVGTIADTRSQDEDVHRRFGLSLGVLQTVWRWQQLQSWEQMLAAAAKQSATARLRGAAQSSALRLAAAVWIGQRTPLPELATFYRKRCPLAAGISNVDLNRDWPGEHHPSPLLDYTRVSPLGPMLPLVFTPTTLGRALNLGFTYRRNIVPDDVASQILDSFVARLRSLR